MKVPEPRELPSGNFFIQLRLNGVSVSVTDPTAKGCKKQAQLIKAEFLAGKRDFIRNSNDKTVELAIKDYISAHEPVLSPSTVQEYKRICDKAVPERIRKIHCSALTGKDLQHCINELSMTRSPKTVRNVMGLILPSVYAVNPVLKNANLLFPQKEKKEIYIPQEPDIQKLLNVAKGTDIEIPILLAAMGSLRRSEICALEKTDIRENGVYISKALVQNSERKWVIKRPKTTSSERLARLPPEVIEKLRSVDGDKITDLTPDQLYKHFKKALEKAGIPPFSFHSLRHYWASVAQMLGMPPYYIMRNGGWSTMSTPNRVYTHIMERADEEYQNKMSAHYAQLANENANANKKIE